MLKRCGLTLAIVTLALTAPAMTASAQTIAQVKGTDAPDNTARNKSDPAPTAQNQSNDRADIRLSATLRRRIIHQKGLSLDAKNIKIISENGSLILRGPVKTAAEKQIIDDMAKKCCTNVPYRNELEVKNQ